MLCDYLIFLRYKKNFKATAWQRKKKLLCLNWAWAQEVFVSCLISTQTHIITPAIIAGLFVFAAICHDSEIWLCRIASEPAAICCPALFCFTDSPRRILWLLSIQTSTSQVIITTLAATISSDIDIQLFSQERTLTRRAAELYGAFYLLWLIIFKFIKGDKKWLLYSKTEQNRTK